MIPLFYVGGPIGAPDSRTREYNIRRAEEVGIVLMQASPSMAYVPHAFARHTEGIIAEEQWVTREATILLKCDALVLVEHWARSPGTRREITHFAETLRPIFTDVWEAVEWANASIQAGGFLPVPYPGVVREFLQHPRGEPA